MRDVEAVVIGAGIFGSLIARALIKAGCQPLVIDAKREGAGSPPAACLMRPSWFSGVGKGVYEPALRKLDELVGLREISFKTALGHATVHWCDPKQVLLTPEQVTLGTVQRVVSVPGTDRWRVDWKYGEDFAVTTKRVIVAAGIWTPTLLPGIEVTPQTGVAWLWPDSSIDDPFIWVWAPYKQIVAFNRGDGLWIGDGTSVRHWHAGYSVKSMERTGNSLVSHSVSYGNRKPIPLIGHRPYVKEAKPCLFKELKKGLWVATGGAKNGTLAAGWCADQIVRML
jgi:glycine/D-amino acid oxidase-like deaminating enzyme